MGDGFLVEFASALEAVDCALSMRASLEKKNLSLSHEHQIKLKIGIHLGDVIHEGNDLYGDSVNVASRIQPLAGPGEIYMTQQVYDHVRSHIKSPVEHIGKVSVKNVELPVDVYKIAAATEYVASTPTPALTGHRIVILPFANISPHSSDEYFADGMTEELISAVSKVSGLRVVSRTSAMKYKGTNKSAPEIARELSCDIALEGSVRKAGKKLRINVDLIDVQKDERAWSQTYDRELEDVFAIQSDIASSVAQALKVRLLTTEKENIERRSTEDIGAYDFYLKGLHYKNEGTEHGFRRAIRYFDQATRKDPKFALAYAGLAESYQRMATDEILSAKEGFPKAEKFASKAIQLDNTIPEAHATLGVVLEDYYWDFRGAEKEFIQALALNPSYGRVCKSYGVYLALMGKLDQAVSEIVRAKQLNPLALDLNECASVVYDWADRYEDSLQACQAMLKIDEEYYPAYLHMADAQAHQAMFDEALKTLKKARKLTKGELPVKGRIAYLHALSGNQVEARKILKELERASKRKHVSPITFARIYCGLGDTNKALDFLEKAYEARDGAVIMLKANWQWTSLRNSARFKKLLEKIGFDENN